jgi:hypothetical protein
VPASAKRQFICRFAIEITWGPRKTPVLWGVGRNARLAAKLTGHLIDIKPQSQAE